MSIVTDFWVGPAETYLLWANFQVLMIISKLSYTMKTVKMLE